MTDETINQILFRKSPEEYGERYQSDYIEIYKLYLTSADNISSRRQAANSFFLTLNAALLAFLGYAKPGNWLTLDRLTIFASLAGIVLCYTWYRLIRSYKGLNSGKFKVIHLIEKNLPLAPYDAEWEAIGRGKDPKSYMPFTHIEIYIPWIFMTIYVIGTLVLTYPWQALFRSLVSVP